MQVWAVIAQKGGQSKTTLSTGFAVEAAREGASVVILDADDRQGSALYWSERRDMDDVMVKDSSVAGLPLHVSRARAGKIDLIIIDTPANSKDIAMLAAEQADFVIIPVAPRGLDVHSVLQTVKQVQQAGTPFAVILTQVPHQGGEAGGPCRLRGEGRDAVRQPPPLPQRLLQGDATRADGDRDGAGQQGGVELRAAYDEAKRLSGFTTKQVSEVA
jgi:chromosome partitioning protein